MIQSEMRWHLNCRQDYLEAVWASIQDEKTRRIMEIGGTTSRSTSDRPLPSHITSFTISDISAEELDHVSDEFDTLQIDACGDIAHVTQTFDLIMSKFCGEHMPDGKQFHKNMHQLLNEGGVAIHLVPTLFASPFLINWMLPEGLTRKAVQLLQPQRFDKQNTGKFPAYYSLCRGSTRYMRNALADIGFSDVEVYEYYGHHYYDKLFGLRQLDNWLSRLCARRSWSFYSSYAIIVTRR
ncbi:class I SAM-dependent methyltransferase [Ruegeria meonggei]|uniref:Methyltransferase type 11 domain-containing protein n=1 Tax=Ruegeria meonggei TaxID=1446476 RepID=A0A1X7AC56_9RHOB|nr:class I SAM-dependent methyltransferase [Ruegeria meonggei]SLN75801.1 hypothetical protein RUM8411_04263 [Ruegeria meonggei]